ncbi:VOC family protein [Variovorax sp. J2P1-59]|uniref:VOC family protein n=1 Tax=Variovorax flavidus TaxID=3053501 RepID=UPI00257730CD|nr:VOC family protein [Variovorax sp. J2P1-59]MDM0078726.1 VOC family protein [Variovorax sp. J2P1-59]
MAARPYLGIDHVVLRTAAAEALFDLLHRQLGLPATWPLQHAPFATYGWIGVGNTNLEIWAAADNSDLPADCPLPLFHQIALAPAELSETLARFSAVGLSCKAPRVYASKDERGEVRTNFTNSVILDLSSESCCVFVCDWGTDAPIVPWRKGLSTPERRDLERGALAACSGGPLGLVGLKEIAMSSPDLAAAADKWQRLAESTSWPVAIADGVELQLAAGKQNLVQSLTLAVRDLGAARRFLVGRELLDEDAAGEVLLSRRATGGLAFRLVEVLAELG